MTSSSSEVWLACPPCEVRWKAPRDAGTPCWCCGRPGKPSFPATIAVNAYGRVPTEDEAERLRDEIRARIS